MVSVPGELMAMKETDKLIASSPSARLIEQRSFLDVLGTPRRKHQGVCRVWGAKCKGPVLQEQQGDQVLWLGQGRGPQRRASVREQGDGLQRLVGRAAARLSARRGQPTCIWLHAEDMLPKEGRAELGRPAGHVGST